MYADRRFSNLLLHRCDSTSLLYIYPPLPPITLPVPVGPREDCFGPYFPQYPTWLGKGVMRGRDYEGRRVCFSSLGWAAATPDSHIWDMFATVRVVIILFATWSGPILGLICSPW